MFEKTTKKSLDKPTSSKFFHMMIPHFQDELVPQSHLCGDRYLRVVTPQKSLHSCGYRLEIMRRNPKGCCEMIEIVNDDDGVGNR